MSPKERKPYEKPRIETESALESTTLACGKCTTGGPTGASTPSCMAVRKLS